VDAIWFEPGQVCCAGSRLLVHEGIAERLVTKLRARMEKLRVGPPLDKAVRHGCGIIAPVQLEQHPLAGEHRVVRRRDHVAAIVGVPTDGYFYRRRCFTNVSPAAPSPKSRSSGRCSSSMTFRTPAEAVELANNTPMDSQRACRTENINLALDVAPKIKAGVVWVNCTNLFDAASGFGGYRESGFGREGGKEGMWEYLKPNWSGEQGAGSGTSQAPASEGSQGHGGYRSRSPLPPIDRT